MKSIYLVLLIPVALNSFNCCGSKKAANNATETKKTEQPVAKVGTEEKTDKKLFRFTVSFISKGAGTDYQLREKFDGFITDFELRNKIKINVSKASWGREGEIDYCFDLSALNKELTDKFIAESKAVLSSSDRINIGENTHCRGEIK